LIPGFKKEPRPLLGFILRVLDGNHRHIIRQHFEYFLYYDFQIRTPEIQGFTERLNEDPALLRYAIDSMIAGMKQMADMWIDSGKSPMDRDVDTPSDRNVEDVLPGRDHSLFQFIDRAFLRGHPRYTEMKRDGSLKIKDTFPRFDLASLQWGLKGALEAHGVKWAAFHFSRLLDSPYSRNLSRCDNCKAYFAYQRVRLRTVTRGVFCSACEGEASMKRTQASREKRLDTAVKAWIEWESKRKGQVQPEWIAEQVNKARGTAFGRRWVSQNLTKIQERVEALRNAKS
jgi:hypothetical protein